jgi:DNA-binding NtrC family response regulator
LIGRYLAMNGYDVIEAEDAEQALALAADHDGPLDVLVTDVLLTGLSGPELSLQLKQRYPALRCLLMSGHPDCVPPDIAGLGADWAFLGKPFQLPEQVHAIRKLMQSSEGADQ